MKLQNGTTVKVHSTLSELDGIVGNVVGIARDFTPLSGSIYVINIPYNGYDTLCLSDSCLQVLG